MLSASWRPAVIALNLALLAMIAYFGARIANTLVAARLDVAPTAPRVVTRVAPKPERIEPLTAYAAIYERDIFNATGTRPAPAAAHSEAAKQSDLNAKLLGTAIAANPAGSYAIIEDLASRTQVLYHVGDSVLDAATLVRVEWDRVVLSRDGAEEILELSLDRRAPGGPGTRPVPAAGSRIRKTADNKYLIDRREVEDTVKNLNEVFTQARAVPFFRDGKTVGFRVFAIKPGSVFERIGLKNGDVVRRVNGVELTDPTKAITLFTELQNEGHIAVDLDRSQKPQSFSYEIR